MSNKIIKKNIKNNNIDNLCFFKKAKLEKDYIEIYQFDKKNKIMILLYKNK